MKECAIKMAVESQTSEAVQLLANKVRIRGQTFAFVSEVSEYCFLDRIRIRIIFGIRILTEYEYE